MIAIVLGDEQALRKFRRHLCAHEGKLVIVGEALSGITIDSTGHWATKGAGVNEVLVADPSAPERAPYRMRGGVRKPTARGNRLEIAGEQIDEVLVLGRDESLLGLRDEYERYAARVEAVEAERDRVPRGDPAWAGGQRRVLALKEQLSAWLARTGYPAAAAKLDAELARDLRRLKDETVRARREEALASIVAVPAPDDLRRAAEGISGDGVRFRVMESRHLRVVALDELDERRIGALLELGERVIESFRTEFVDPYLGDDFEETLPEGRFVEFWFGPEDVAAHERYFTEYYGAEWGEHREQRIARPGARARGTLRAEYLEYWRLAGTNDRLEGILVHGLGHFLANAHYSRGGGWLQDWVDESLAHYLTMQHLGYSNRSCSRYGDGRYAKSAGAGADRSDEVPGRRRALERLALERGSSIDAIALKTLHDLSDADLAKAICLFDDVARHEGKPGQLWLRSALWYARDPSTFIDRWRSRSEELFGVPEGDVFQVIDARWRERTASGGR